MTDDPVCDDSRAIQQLGNSKAVLAFWRAGRAIGRGKALDIVVVRTLIWLSDLRASEEVLNDSDERHPNDFYLTALRSEVRQAAGDLAEAFRLVQRAAVQDPSNLPTRFRAALLAIRMRCFDVAIDHLHAALEEHFNRQFDVESVFPLLCLQRIYAISGPKSADVIAAWLARLAERQQRQHIELSPFLNRIASSRPSTTGDSHLGQLATDPRARVLYRHQSRHNQRIPVYNVWLRDIDQSHIRLPCAIVSGSFGAVWHDDMCFALDHGFHSSRALCDFDIGSKIILTHDMSLTGFSLRERRAYQATDRETSSIDAEVLVIPPCHHQNFGHFVHDVLLNKMSFDRLKIEFPTLKILLLRSFPNANFKAAFEANFGDDYIIADCSEINYSVTAAHLLTPPHTMWPDDGNICVEPARYLRRHLASKQVGSRRIYVARAGSEGSSSLHHQIFGEFGFEVNLIENLTEEDCLSCFANASHIAGTHGAGLMNLVFAPPNVKIAELKRSGGNWHSIATFAAATNTDFNVFEADLDAESLRINIAAWLGGHD